MILIFPNPKAFLIFYAGSVETLAEISEGLCRMQQELMGFCSAGPLTYLSHAPGTSLLPLTVLFLLLHSKVDVGCYALVTDSAGRGLPKGVFPCLKGPAVPSKRWNVHTLAVPSCQCLRSLVLH